MRSDASGCDRLDDVDANNDPCRKQASVIGNVSELFPRLVLKGGLMWHETTVLDELQV